LHKKLFGRISELNDLNVRVQWIGRPFDSPDARTPRYVQKAIAKAIDDTAQNTGMLLTVAFDYGSRAEIIHAAERALAASPDRITAADIDAHMYLPELPHVDVVVRTSGELRISNFMLWQSSGTRVYFTEQTWPDFGAAELDAAIAVARR
jgi:undecaprenyl diphosphate synthase